MTISPIQPRRRLAEAAQAVLFLGLPFVRIGGESALRFDIPTLRLHFFGISLWMDEFFIVLIALFFFTFLIIFITQVFGRIWCGWLCPQTVIIDMTGFLDRAKVKRAAERVMAYILIFLISVIVAADLIWYFVSPYDFFPALARGALGNVTWGSWLVLSAVIFLNFAFLRHTWCATACPYARLQGALFDSRTMVISFDSRRKDECMDCRACVRCCPVNIDIRNGLNAACVSCAECIDTCAKNLGRQNKNGLIGYFFGNPGATGSLIRSNVVMFGLLTLLTLIFFLYLSLSRNPLDLTVLPNNEIRARMSNGNMVMNGYILAVENRSKDDLMLSLKALSHGMQLKITPEQLVIRAGEYKRIPAYVFFPVPDRTLQPGNAELLLEAGKQGDVRASRNVNLMLPETP